MLVKRAQSVGTIKPQAYPSTNPLHYPFWRHRTQNRKTTKIRTIVQKSYNHWKLDFSLSDLQVKIFFKTPGMSPNHVVTLGHCPPDVLRVYLRNYLSVLWNYSNCRHCCLSALFFPAICKFLCSCVNMASTGDYCGKVGTNCLRLLIFILGIPPCLSPSN
jgi:hypothetical protein